AELTTSPLLPHTTKIWQTRNNTVFNSRAMVKNLFAATLTVWVAVLCIERSMEYRSTDSPASYQSIERTLEKSIPDLVVSLKAAEARKDYQSIDKALWQLATTNWQLSKFDRADLFLQRLLALREQEGGPDNLRLVPVLQAAGGVQRDWGKFKEAARFYERARQIDTHAQGADSTQVSRDINNL